MKIRNALRRITLVLLLGLPALLMAAGGPSPDDEQPTIAKDWVQVKAFTLSSYHKNYAIWSWVPSISFRVNGPIASGSQLSVEFAIPGTGPWVKFDCKTSETQKGYWWNTECGGRDIPEDEDKGSTYTGPVNFAIKLHNELTSTNATLFTGKMKVGKARSNESGPKVVNHYVYYVDQDWNLPIGYLFYEPNDVRGWNFPSFAFAVWVRGESSALLEPHLLHDGKEVGKLFYQGEEVGKASCGSSEVENNTTQYTTPQGPKFIWTRWKCGFPNVHPWNKTGEKMDSMFGQPSILSENPGDYEVKVLYKGHLVRSIKFAVDAEGKIVDNGIATANKLGSDRIIVPVRVLGDLDGPWDKAAWKTSAFYGNPLTGFAAVQ